MNYRVPNIMAVFALVGLVMTAYLRWARPYQLRWGATDEELQRPMPGDELNSNPKFLATRAITIEGEPEDISGPGWCRWDIAAPDSMAMTSWRTSGARAGSGVRIASCLSSSTSRSATKSR